MENFRAVLCVTGLILMGPVGADSVDDIKTLAGTVGSPGSIKYDTCARPAYPELEFKQNKQGVVTLLFFLGTDGSVKESKIHVSSGYSALDEAALVAISKCRFNPPMVDGRPVEGWTAIQYVWKK